MNSIDFTHLDNSSLLSLLGQMEEERNLESKNKNLVNYYFELEDLVKEFITKYGYGVKSDNPKYSTFVNNEDINQLKRHLESKISI